MKILIAHNRYAAESGEEHALNSIAAMLRKNGHRVRWFLRSSENIHRWPDKVDAFISGIHSPRAVSVLRSYLQQHAIDVVLLQNLYPFLSPSILPVFKEFDIPVIMRCPNYRLFCPNGLHLSHGEICERCLGGREYWCALRNCEDDRFKSLGYALRNAAARVTRRIVDHVDRFVVLSEFQRRRFIDGGIAPKKLAILPNVAPSVAMKGSDAMGEFVSFVGRVSPEKGIEDFLAAAARLPEISFAVAGSIDSMPHLPAGSPPNVRWMGFLEGEALDSFFRQSCMMVFPSRWFEGFPNVIARAMAHGNPVVASRLGAVPEIVEDWKTGLLFESGNVEELTGKIQALYRDTELCQSMGARGREKAVAEYSPGAVGEKLQALLQEAINVGRSGSNLE